jgi:hypothetical protein
MPQMNTWYNDATTNFKTFRGLEMTATQKHIADHFTNGTLNPFNERCLVGMIETGEATYDDLLVVGGHELVARISKQVKC